VATCAASSWSLDFCLQLQTRQELSISSCGETIPPHKEQVKETLEAMKTIFYSAAWTECGILLSDCWHEHGTIGEANCCIARAGGYVVAVENGVMRALTPDEEAEFQRVHYAPRTDKPDTTVPLAAQRVSSDFRYAVMVPIFVVDHWTWATWMCFPTYAEAVARARRGNKVVRFASEEWAALKQQKWAAQPRQTEAAPLSRVAGLARLKGEIFFEFVLRILDARGLEQNTEPVSEEKHVEVDPNILSILLSRLSRWERNELARLYAEDKNALLRALGRFLQKGQRGLR
jgi:hypothetical protein